ncbi:membrane-bound lytic murein transglycosylase A [Candidatus Kinetoplastibacterium desouzaii TCC079E]|uniref:peptidoglycan lytic exotransglycosylase n=1 Tax=Candidatus Kinetoplastidibacterium desouzai TCC079E TaxID=1208919 RepID=M1LR15_9PROT|nr:MltA domain-containing protein [Candidatus Kinetoplastibacterium desouzaii]AGF46606.1 membrane-bound lytic murein transglycosylase A [Candidatus Kinetoplastibacterium desouzaii TCC079E]
MSALIFNIYFFSQCEAFNVFDSEDKKNTTINFLPVSWEKIPGWHEENFIEIWSVFLKNCKNIKNFSGNTVNNCVSKDSWNLLCNAAFDFENTSDSNNKDKIRKFLHDHLTPWSVVDKNKNIIIGKMTGYYEPLLKGSRCKHGDYQWPIFGIPNDLITLDLGLLYPECKTKIVRGKIIGNRFLPYDSRSLLEKRIDDLPVIAWVNDPIDRMLLEIQGSGRICIEEDYNNIIRVSYALSNGHPFVSIRKWLLDNEGVHPEPESLRQWAKDNPLKIRNILNKNPSVIFFIEEKSDRMTGPIGSYGVNLTPLRSIAVDSNYIPLGTPVFISTRHPKFNTMLSRVLFAHDTGSLVKGIDHIDLFWGFGDDAEKYAHITNHPYEIWILWPKTEDHIYNIIQ